MLKGRVVGFGAVLLGMAVATGARTATACVDPFPPGVGTKLELLPMPQNGFRLTLFGGEAYGSPAGEGCGCAIALPIKVLQLADCAATAFRITDASSAFGSFGVSPNTQADFDALMQSQVPHFSGRFVVAGFSTVLANAIAAGESLRLEADFECNVPFDEVLLKKIKPFLARSAVLGTGPVNPDGTIDFTQPTHLGITKASVNEKCTGGKTKCIAKKATALLKCHTRAESTGAAVDPLCEQKAQAKFDDPVKGCYAKAEKKGGCLTQGDAPAVEAAIDVFVVNLVTQLDPGFPTPVQNVCSAKKKTCAGKNLKKALGCYSKAQQKGLAVAPACLALASTQFGACFSAAETVGSCLTTGDAAAIGASLDAFLADASCAVDPSTCP